MTTFPRVLPRRRRCLEDAKRHESRWSCIYASSVAPSPPLISDDRWPSGSSSSNAVANNINHDSILDVTAITDNQASGLRSDELVVIRFLDEAGVVANNEPTMYMNEMHAFVRGWLNRWRNCFRRSTSRFYKIKLSIIFQNSKEFLILDGSTVVVKVCLCSSLNWGLWCFTPVCISFDEGDASEPP